MFIINMQEKICRLVEVNHITLSLTYYLSNILDAVKPNSIQKSAVLSQLKFLI